MKETISKVKRQPSEWEKIIANEATESPEINPHIMDNLSLTKRARIYNGEKTISLTSGAGKTDQTLVKKE